MTKKIYLKTKLTLHFEGGRSQMPDIFFGLMHNLFFNTDMRCMFVCIQFYILLKHKSLSQVYFDFFEDDDEEDEDEESLEESESEEDFTENASICNEAE